MATLTTSFQKIATGNSVTYGAATAYLELWAKYNSQDISNNRSNVTVELRLVVSGGYVGNYQSTYWSISGSLSNSGDIGSGSHRSQTLGSATGNISHNSDGTGSVSFSGVFNPTAWGYTTSVSGSATLPTIPRASTVTCTSGTIGDTLTISIDKKSSSFTSTVSYHILDYSSLTATIAEKTSSTTLYFDTSTIKSQIYALMPNSRTIAGTIRCRTYSGDTKIGDTQVANFTLSAKQSECVPDLTYTMVDTNSEVIEVLGTNQVLIKGISQPKVTLNGIPKYSATIQSYTMELNGVSYNGQEHTFDSLTGDMLEATVTDSRNYTLNSVFRPSIVNYFEPSATITVTRAVQDNNNAYVNMTGIWFNNHFGSTDNVLTMTWIYREVGSQEWINGGTIIPTMSGNNIILTDYLLGDIFNYAKEYEIKFTLTDLFSTKEYVVKRKKSNYDLKDTYYESDILTYQDMLGIEDYIEETYSLLNNFSPSSLSIPLTSTSIAVCPSWCILCPCASMTSISRMASL